MNDLLSVILLSYQSEKNLAKAVSVLHAEMTANRIPFELIIMDDGSTDKSFEIALSLSEKHVWVKAYQLSKNWGSIANCFAGLTQSQGACATIMHDDLQVPVEVITEMYQKWKEGNKLIFPIRAARDDGRWNDLFSNLFYKIINNFSNVELPKYGSDSWLLDREVIDIILKHFPRNNTLSVELLQYGFNPLFIPFERKISPGKSRWSRRKKIKLAMDTFFGVSNFPIKLMSIFGFLVFGICSVLILIIVAAKLFSNNSLFGFPIPGWTTTIVFITMFNGLILLCLGILAEYIWRIYEEVKGRPGYIIKKDKD